MTRSPSAGVLPPEARNLHGPDPKRGSQDPKREKQGLGREEGRMELFLSRLVAGGIKRRIVGDENCRA